MNNCRKVLWFAKALTGPRRFVAIGCLALILSVHGASAQGIASYDWTRFNWDAGRSGDATASTGIDATNIASLQRQQVHIGGTVDASAIYLHGVAVNDSSHDVFFVTTTYGKALAIDANNGSTLWTFTPAGYTSWAGSAQITNATPVADPNRQFIYAASPDGHIQKIAVANGHAGGARGSRGFRGAKRSPRRSTTLGDGSSP